MGMRVTVRRVVDRDAEGRLQFADVVGDLLSLDDETAVVEGRHGPVDIPVGLVVAARPAVPSTADELALQATAAAALQPAETEPLGGWLLRADGGFTRRANSVLPLRQPGMPVGEALQRAHDWYAARGLPLIIQVPLEARRLLDAELRERGWADEAETDLLTARLDRLTAEPAVDPAPVSLAREPDDAWLTAYRDGGALTSAGRALLTRHENVAFARVELDGAVVAVGRGTVDDGWLGVMAVEVAPPHRRRGLATAIMTALWQWGRTEGATRSYVQVLADNAPAQGLYARMGYHRHHSYHYRCEP